MTAYVVIGAGFGDEGKGLMTDYLVNRLRSPWVLRFNGGAQASHTVATVNGDRHIFGHIGAGTLAGAGTMLSSDFIVNPYLLQSELKDVNAKGYAPTILIHEDAAVTTIFDMAINAAIELARDEKRHGSCGIGINETVTRQLAGFKLTAWDVAETPVKELVQRIKHIHEHWVPRRLAQLELTDLLDRIHLATGGVLRNDNYEEHAAIMKAGLQHTKVVNAFELREHLWRGPLVMEGAQGLALDEELGAFPHVTRSKTGLPFAVNAAKQLRIDTLQPIYITRCYATRHGAGPLLHEGEKFCDRSISDSTNVTNAWQGTIRFAPLDLQHMNRLIEADLLRSQRQGVTVLAPIIAVTCLDQVGAGIRLYDVEGKEQFLLTQDVPAFIEKQLGVTVGYTSFGATSVDVVQKPCFGV